MKKYTIKRQVIVAFSILSLFFLNSCKEEVKSDAYGNFEATPVTVSAKGNGELLSFTVSEGKTVAFGEKVGVIDTTQVYLEKVKLLATISSLGYKLKTAVPDVSVLLNKKSNLVRERDRTVKLFAQKAATQKQLDGLNGQIAVVEKQIIAIQSKTKTANSGVLSNKKPLKAQMALLEKKLKDYTITNPISGTVLTKFVEQNEFVRMGTPLYRIANLNNMTLKAYTSATLLQNVKINDKVTVLIDAGKEDYKELEGKITWLSSEAEFTPKTIQTKEERVNLIYAIKVVVPNDGTIRIGMPGEVNFKTNVE